MLSPVFSSDVHSAMAKVLIVYLSWFFMSMNLLLSQQWFQFRLLVFHALVKSSISSLIWFSFYYQCTQSSSKLISPPGSLSWCYSTSFGAGIGFQFISPGARSVGSVLHPAPAKVLLHTSAWVSVWVLLCFILLRQSQLFMPSLVVTTFSASKYDDLLSLRVHISSLSLSSSFYVSFSSSP